MIRLLLLPTQENENKVKNSLKTTWCYNDLSNKDQTYEAVIRKCKSKTHDTLNIHKDGYDKRKSQVLAEMWRNWKLHTLFPLPAAQKAEYKVTTWPSSAQKNENMFTQKICTWMFITASSIKAKKQKNNPNGYQLMNRHQNVMTMEWNLIQLQ